MHGSTSPRRRSHPLRLAAPLAGVALVLAACSTGGGAATTAPAASAEVPSEAPAGAPTLEGTNWQLTG